MSPDEIEWIMRQSTWSLEVEGQHPDAQTMEWCRQMLGGATSGFQAFGGYAFGCVLKTAQTADTGVTVRGLHFVVRLF